MHLSALLAPINALRELTASTPEIYEAAAQLDQAEANLVGMHERLQLHDARRPRRRHFVPPHGSPAAYDDEDGRRA